MFAALPPTLPAASMRASEPFMGTLLTKRTFYIQAPYVGNQDFDPLQLHKRFGIVPMRHAEVKHGRLAMLAAVAWPMQELIHPVLVKALTALRLPHHLLTVDGYTPSLLHGGLDAPEVTAAFAFMTVAGSLAEMPDIRRRMAAGLAFNEYAPNSVAGDLDFDPLNLSTDLGVTDRFELQEAEIINGRLAMLACMAYVMIEANGQRIIDFSPW